MTVARTKVSASLADRGRPEFWANEQESAALSGMTADIFAKRLADLEAKGFPKISPWNGKRFIPHIIAFWEGNPQPDSTPAKEDGQDAPEGQERWDNDGRRTGPRFRRAG